MILANCNPRDLRENDIVSNRDGNHFVVGWNNSPELTLDDVVDDKGGFTVLRPPADLPANPDGLTVPPLPCGANDMRVGDSLWTLNVHTGQLVFCLYRIDADDWNVMSIVHNIAKNDGRAIARPIPAETEEDRHRGERARLQIASANLIAARLAYNEAHMNLLRETKEMSDALEGIEYRTEGLPIVFDGHVIDVITDPQTGKTDFHVKQIAHWF